MHPPVRARKVGITVHVLGEYRRSIHMRCQQSIAELVRVETLGKPRHMPRRMVFDVNLPPWAGTPCGDAGIDPEFLGDTAAHPEWLPSRHTSGLPLLPGNLRGNPCPYARSGGRLQEAATICRVRHDRDSCEPAAPALNGPPRVIPACMIGPSVILPPEASGVAWRWRPPLSAVRLVSRRPRALASCASGRHRTFDSTARWQAVEPLLQREYRKCRRRCPQRCYRDGTHALAGALVLGDSPDLRRGPRVPITAKGRLRVR